MEKSAILSNCRRYRYSLTRTWDYTKGYLNVIGLNPSTADEIEDDPTIRRCIGFAKSWGMGGLVMTNLFAFRATKPSDMLNAHYPIGLENDDVLLARSNNASMILAAWGANGGHIKRDEYVKQMITNMYCLKKTKAGHPSHPLYIRADTTPFIFH